MNPTMLNVKSAAKLLRSVGVWLIAALTLAVPASLSADGNHCDFGARCTNQTCDWEGGIRKYSICQDFSTGCAAWELCDPILEGCGRLPKWMARGGQVLRPPTIERDAQGKNVAVPTLAGL